MLLKIQNSTDLSSNLEVGDELDGALASDEVMVNNATDGQHGEAAILDLLERPGLGVSLGEAERVELEVTRSALALEGLEKSDSAENLSERNPEQDLAHSAGRDELVMGGSQLRAAGDLGVARILNKVLNNRTGNGKHGNAAMLDLGLLKELYVEQGRKAERIEASVPRQGFIKSRGLLEERHRRGHLHLGANGSCQTLKVSFVLCRWRT
jgi:hypothetical protein